jgi:hypothetical protein
VSIEESKSAYPHSDAPELLALRDYAQQIGIAQPGSSSAPRLRMAQADNAFDALRDLFGRGAQPSPAPNSAPDPAPGATPKAKPRPTPKRAKPASPSYVEPVLVGSFVGSKTCLG